MRQAARHVFRPPDAEDALQDACVQFMRRYDGEGGTHALRWMLLVVKRCAWAIGERQRRHESHRELTCTDADIEDEVPLLAVDDGSLDPHLVAERTEQHAMCTALLARLKPDQRAALLLLGLGFSYREIGELRGWTYTKVNRCLAEGRAALRADTEGQQQLEVSA
jgi:RNA polymerase sigma factor (sigma-70 family)